MSGHSKWASIKHKKGAADAKRGKVFSKLAKQISVAAKEGGTDLSMNFGLRLLVDKAKKANMPKDNIERAIARGTGEGSEGAQIQTVLYEAMGPGGATILVEAMTDNTNRTLGNVKTVFNRMGGNLGASVKWMFERKGVVRVENISKLEDRDEIELVLIDAGAEEIRWDDEIGLEIICATTDLQKIKEAVESVELEVSSADLEYLAKDKIKLSSEDEEKMGQIIDMLDNDEDVTNVYTNAA